MKVPHESNTASTDSPGLVSRVWDWLARFLNAPAVILIGAIWAAFTLAGNWFVQLKGITSGVETAHLAADRARDTEELKLAFSLIDKMDCAEDETAKKRQKMIRELILLGAKKYSSVFANQLEACARTPEQKAEAQNYRDLANRLDLVDQFSRNLQRARARMELGVRDAELLKLFEDAARGLPEELGNQIDKEALDAARNAGNEKNFDVAAAYYFRAFQQIR